MRFAFWRRGKDETDQDAAKPSIKGSLMESLKAAKMPSTAPRAVVKPEPKAAVAGVARQPQPADAGDLDLRAIWQTLLRKKHFILIPTACAMVLALIAVNMISPRYKSEARILIDGRENIFLRPNGERTEERTALDAEAVTSQVQLLLSRDLAREVIKKNKLAERPEFDPVLQGTSPIKAMLALFGIGRDPFQLTPEERVLDAYFDRLTAFAVDKSRVVVIEFQSRDPELAAKVANSIADGYLTLQQSARQDQAKSAGQWLSVEIDSLRKKVAEAEGRADDFRSKANLFIGSNNTSLSSQQLSEINTQLNAARAQKSDAETKARLIREMLNTGKPIEASEVMNSELTRRLSEQRVTLRAQLAEQSSTLLDRHPRILELKAQLSDLDRQLRDEAGKLSRSFENDAKIAGAKVEGLSSNLDQMKKQATATNGQDVQLRAMEREAKAQRDLLESYLAKYREATTRENIDAAPSDGRIISRAIVSNTAAYPKKLPIVLIATLATLMLTAGYIATAELLRMTAPRPMLPVQAASAAPLAPATSPSDTDVAAVAATLLAAGYQARKITVLGSGREDGITLTALALSRKMAERAKVVLVDLSAAGSLLQLASVDPSAPGLADLLLSEVSFGQIVTRDRMTALHLVGAGRTGVDRELFQSPRLSMTLDALLRVYDHVVLNAGVATDLGADLLTMQARGILVPDASMSPEAQVTMTSQLKAVGFADVMVLHRVSNDAAGAAPRVVAA
ncbi:MAG: lipopolysaccharide biosynthesis [Tardiphaga sp.]|nr:lipopolysaccharide biosynthesis [Tardiphaga sp.]